MKRSHSSLDDSRCPTSVAASRRGAAHRTLAGLVATLCFFCTDSFAGGLLWDFSPETTDAPPNGDEISYMNIADATNFAEFVRFRWPAELTGLDIYSSASFGGAVGDTMTVRIWSGQAGLPQILLHDFTETVSQVDTEGIGQVSTVSRKHVDFTLPVTLQPFKDYWIGMSGTFSSATQMGLSTNPPDDGRMAVFYGLEPNYYTDVGDMAFRLFGTLADNDYDGVPNDQDNCLNSANSDQRDSDGDNIGNRCDPDLDNSCLVDSADFDAMVALISTTDEDADLNGDGIVSALDVIILQGFLSAKPGASAFANACDSPPDIAFASVPASPLSETVTLDVATSDDFGVLAVSYYSDGRLIGTATAAPFAVAWNTLDDIDGEHTLTATAEDAVGNVANAEPVTVAVHNGRALLWDFSPASTDAPATGYRPGLSNHSYLDNVAESIAFRLDASLLAMDIYGTSASGIIGDTVAIRIWSDRGGLPDELLHDFTATLSAIDLVSVGQIADITRKHADFPAVVELDAFQNYWIGMSGAQGDFGSIIGLQVNPPGDGRIASFRGLQPYYLNPEGDMPFRLLGFVADTDADGVSDSDDNCLAIANSDQTDADGDNIGNRCDPDLDGSCTVNFADLSQFKAAFFSSDENADLNGDGIVNFSDLAILKSSFFGKPGPSALVNACDTPPEVILAGVGPVVSAIATLSATAQDDFGVVAVRFRVDGEPIGTITAPPYEVTWDTTEVLDGEHTLTAEAEDGVGNLSVSMTTVVTVQNGVTALWDYSPAATNAPVSGDVLSYSNETDGPNFGETMFFQEAVLAKGIDFYSRGWAGHVGDIVTVRVWSDQNGLPGTLLHNFPATVARVDLTGVGVTESITRKHVSFPTPVMLSANADLWIGVSGTSEPLAQMTLRLNPPGDGLLAAFNGLNFSSISSIGDMAFRLLGATAAGRSAMDAAPAVSTTTVCARKFSTLAPNASRTQRVMLQPTPRRASCSQ